MKIRNFFGQSEEIPKDLYKIIESAHPVLNLPLFHFGKPHYGGTGSLQIRQRGASCLALNSYEPRALIVCWANDGVNYTDISFHREMGGERGALDALKRMFERYTGRGT